MFDFFSKKYDELLSSVFEPVFQRVLLLTWPKRVLLLVLLPALVATWKYTDIVTDAARFSVQGTRVLLVNSPKIPLAKNLVAECKEVQARLLMSTQNDVAAIPTGALTGWSASQTLLSIADASSVEANKQALAAFTRAKELPQCHCWPELNPDDEKRAWTFISGWVLTAFASVDMHATEEEVEFLLKNQNPDGSWSSIPVVGLMEYASTYTTAWAIIGLTQQLKLEHALPDAMAARATTAVQRGSAWLIAKRQAGARWKPYPNLGKSSISGSVSGLVMHALHMTAPNRLSDIDKEWLDNIPASAIPASIGEMSYVEINVTGTVQNDHFLQLTMPWMLIGTIDAYPNGNLFQKAKALNWVERIVRHDSVRNADTEQTNWGRAELLIAINYLLLNIEE